MPNLELISDDELEDLRFIREKVALDIFNIMKQSRKTISEMSEKVFTCYQSKNPIEEIDLVEMLNTLAKVDEELQDLDRQIEIIELGKAATR